jgi:tetratricopeptide (TPR) repeat protein
MPRLSLIMIVKNEEEMLPKALASARDVVDEMIVVDTGSTDRTVQVAERAGAKVHFFKWNNSFADARNASIRAATGDWLLILDADERLGPGLGPLLRETIARDDIDLVMLPLHHASRLDATPEDVFEGRAKLGEPVLLQRLMRKTPDLAYEGVVHETVKSWLDRRLNRVTGVNAPIIHYGAIREYRTARGKQHRNIELLLERCKCEPENPIPRSFIASEYMGIGEVEKARAYIEEGWALLLRQIERTPKQRPAFIELTSLRAQVFLAIGQPEVAVETVEKALNDWESDHPNMHFLRGRALERLALRNRDPVARRHQLIEAVRSFKRCVELRTTVFPEETFFEITGPIGWNWLVFCLVELEQADTAKEAIDAAIEDFPRSMLLQFARIEILIELGRAREAIALLQPHLVNKWPDPWFLAAYACDMLGMIDEMEHFVREARAREELGFVGVHRKERLPDLEAAVSLYRGRPRAGVTPVGLLCGLIGRIPMPRALDESPAANPRVVRRILKNLLDLGKGHLLEPLFEPRAAAMLPSLPEVATRILSDMGVTLTDDGWETPILVGGTRGAAVDELCATLHRHPHFSPPIESGSTVPELDSRRLVARAASVSEFHAFSAAFPRARFLHVVADASPETARFQADARELGPQLLEVDVRNWAANEDRQIRRILAFLGEPWDDALAGEDFRPVGLPRLTVPIMTTTGTSGC